LARLGGERLAVNSTDAAVHALASSDDRLRIYNVLVWNFSTSPREVKLTFSGLPKDLRMRHLTFDTQTASNDENLRLRPTGPVQVKKGEYRLASELEPYGMQLWSFE
jgi:hypothetical protein